MQLKLKTTDTSFLCTLIMIIMKEPSKQRLRLIHLHIFCFHISNTDNDHYDGNSKQVLRSKICIFCFHDSLHFHVKSPLNLTKPKLGHNSHLGDYHYHMHICALQLQPGNYNAGFQLSPKVQIHSTLFFPQSSSSLD